MRILLNNLFFVYILFFSRFLWASDFSNIIEIMKAHDPAWKSVDIEEGSADIKSFSKGLFWTPKLSLEASQVDAFSSYESFSRNQGLAFGAQLNLWKNGSDWASWSAARSRKQAARSKTLVGRQKLLADYSKLLLDYEKIRQSREIVKSQDQVQSKNLKVSKRRYESGQLSKSEFEKIELDTLMFNEQRDDQERLWLDIQESLKQRLSGELVSIQDWPWKSLLKKLYRPSEIPPIQEALPLQILNYEKEAQHSDLRSALAELIGPSLDLSASYGRDYEHMKKLGNANRWGLGLTLSWVLYDGFKDYSNYRNAVYAYRSKDRDLQVAQRDNVEQWESLWRKFNHLFETAQKREALQEKTKEMLNRSQSLFLSGRIDVNTLGLDQNRWLESRLRLVDSWYQTHMTLVEICKTWSWDSCPSELKP